MRQRMFWCMVVLSLCLTATGYAAPNKETVKKRIFVVSSYNREYAWSQETNQGFCDAMLKFGYFDDAVQAGDLTKNDGVETATSVIKKMWMDTKRKKSKAEKLEATARINRAIRDFKPDLLFLGDDDAAEYIGNQFLDTKLLIIFWGVNNTPVKYGLVDRADRPGHNVTGSYQPGYYRESLELLKRIVPKVKTFAVLTDDSTAGRSHYKAIKYLARQGALPLALKETVITGDYELFKARALELQNTVDAFFVAQYSSLRDKDGAYVKAQDVISWYVTNIHVPETAEQGQFVRQGLLCGADDSGYNQGFEAVRMAHDIIDTDANPAAYPPRAPKRGALMVNEDRARTLGITLSDKMGIEEYVYTVKP